MAVDTRLERSAGDLAERIIALGYLSPIGPQVEETPRRVVWSRGQRVVILEGPYGGRRGRITRLHNLHCRSWDHRATVRVKVDGKVTFVRLSLNQLEPM